MRKALMLGVCLVLATPLFAQPAPPPAGPDGDQARAVVVRFLQLTQEQADQWQLLLDARKGQVQPLREQLAGVEAAVKDLLSQDQPDPAQVGALVIQAKGLHEQIAAADQAYLDGFEAMLTQDQAQRLNGLRRAAQVQPILPAFRVFGLLHDAPAPPNPDPGA